MKQKAHWEIWYSWDDIIYKDIYIYISLEESFKYS